MSEQERAREISNAVGRGMVIAAGIIVSVWGDEVQAEEILGAAGITTLAKCRECGVDAYDARLLRRVFANLKRRGVQ